VGLADALIHFFIKVCINAVIMFIVLWWLLEIPPNKVPSLLLISMIVGAVSHLVASVLLAGRRGF